MKTQTKNAAGEEVAGGYSTAIDYHRRYSIVLTQDPAGRQVRQARITGNAPAAFAEYFQSLGGPGAVVIEACWNWEWLYEVLEKIDGVREIVVADPLKTRLIAEAQIKTDKVDARALVTLLRAGLVCRIHVPSRRSRGRKALLRQRMFWVRQRTQIRNRVHTLLARQHGLELPARRDLFGAGGRRFLRALRLRGHDALLLGQDLAMLEALEAQVAAAEARAAREFRADPTATRLQSLPGVGPLLGAVIAAEIDTIDRFPSRERFVAYAGLAPSTFSSGGKCHHGPLLWQCNKWLRWAFIEAAWNAIRHSPCFATLYARHCRRGKHTNTAAVIVARPLAQIAFLLLKEKRLYHEPLIDLPGRSHVILRAA